jgi:Tfp pilus assembly pilus retraction ATPase PilT
VVNEDPSVPAASSSSISGTETSAACDFSTSLSQSSAARTFSQRGSVSLNLQALNLQALNLQALRTPKPLCSAERRGLGERFSRAERV